ncbi:MAG: hypothetical protein E6H04_13300 [Bacillati bacterium ANGP1]|uniref:WD40 repeat domain-containing protein n=1 Tax=Candidatus Segetimicrobium genomatis TaxID=2569760 RepID=A0A537J308_9BACT|nr:MAG: hypothetical protein E6H04_13300 [Terrabacteria group bacterium ANGP1]
MSVNRSVLRAAMITTLVTAVVLLSWQGTPRSLAGILTDASAALGVPVVPEPPYLSPISPPPFGTTITRIAGDPGTAIPFTNGGSGQWNTDARHHYSTDEPWNADQTLIAMDQPGGNPGLLFLDGRTYLPVMPQCANYNRRDDRWHPTLPSVRINADGTLLEWFDVVHCVQVMSWTLPLPVSYLGMTNGNVSADGRFVALADQMGSMFVVDMQANRIGPIAGYAYNGWVATGVGISASGKYVWVHYSGDSNRIFDVDPNTLALTPHPETGPICHGAAVDGSVYDVAHQDVGLNPFDKNEDVMVGQEHCGNVGQVVNGQLVGHVIMVRLRDGAITSLTDPTNEAYAYHVSLRATRRPGWAYVSYYEGQDGRRFDQEIIAVPLDGSTAVERWAHLHTETTDCYRCEAHPVPSWDGLRLIFASTWSRDCDGGCGTQAVRQDYVVDRGP